MRIRDKGCGKPYGFRILKGKVKGGCDFREAERTPAADGMELIYPGIQGRVFPCIKTRCCGAAWFA